MKQCLWETTTGHSISDSYRDLKVYKSGNSVSNLLEIGFMFSLPPWDSSLFPLTILRKGQHGRCFFNWEASVNFEVLCQFVLAAQVWGVLV